MRRRTFTVSALVIALVVAGLLSYYASPHPDGLMHVAQAQGFVSTGSDSLTGDWPLAGYAVDGLGNARLSGGLAGVMGCVACFVLVGLATRRRSGPRDS